MNITLERRCEVIPGQISIFEIMEEEKKCTDCGHWFFNRCTWGEMMKEGTTKCRNQDKWVLGDDAKIRRGLIKEYRNEKAIKMEFTSYGTPECCKEAKRKLV